MNIKWRFIFLIVLAFLVSGNSWELWAEKPLAPFFIEEDIYDFDLTMESFVVEPKYTDYKLRIDVSYLPENKNLKNLPIVYVTDGHWRRMDHKYIHYLSYKKIIPPVIVAGIGYTAEDNADLVRMYDLVFEPRNFIREITEELIPLVEKEYSVDAGRRILFGSSAGGHFVTYTFLNNVLCSARTFSGYIGASSALLGSRVFSMVEEFKPIDSDTKVHLYLTYGGKEDDYLFKEPNERLFSILDEQKSPDFSFNHHTYLEADHFATTRLTLVDGLRLILGSDQGKSIPKGVGAVDLKYDSFAYDFRTSTQVYDWQTGGSGEECLYSIDPKYSCGNEPGSIKVPADFTRDDQLVFQTSSVYFPGFADQEVEFNLLVPKDLAQLNYRLRFLLLSSFDIEWITDQSEGFPINKRGWNTFKYKWRGKDISGNVDCIRGFGIIIERNADSPEWKGDLYFDNVNW